jgi:cell wall-associated NlpC family hydrolase
MPKMLFLSTCWFVMLVVLGLTGFARVTFSAQVAPQADAAADADDEGDTGESESINEAADAKAYTGPYQSPYKLAFKVPLHELLFDAKGPRGSVAEESSVPPQEWYSPKVKQKWGSWGVPPRRFDCPPQVAGKPIEWRRERVVAAATRFIGYEYQHHHVPDWDPPAGWPWQKCCAGRNGKGLDCSNFSGWNYNWALGIHLNTDIHKQAAVTKAPSTHGEVTAETIHRPEGSPAKWYAALCEKLAPGDLLYISNTQRTKVTHVIMWVGNCAESPEGVPLVIDSTGGQIKDSNGHAIPCGIHLRPFRKGSWYHHSFSHAHRWVK